MHRINSLRLATMIFCFLIFVAYVWADDGPFSKSVDLDADKSPEQISLIFNDKDEDGFSHGSLKVVSKNKSFDKDLGDSFWPDLTRLDILAIGKKIKPFIVVDSAGGAHSEKRQIFSFDGKSIQEILDITSDAPSITEADMDGDGILEVIAKQRDYAKDPTVDSREIVYKWDGARFFEVK